MRVTRSTFRRAALGVAALGMILGGTLSATSATAAPRLDPAGAESLVRQLGTQSGGSYVDETGTVVVNVTDEAAAAKVRAKGAVPRLVARSLAQLQQVTADLDATARISGTAWAIDPVSNTVIVSADETVTGAKQDQLYATLARHGAAIRYEPLVGTLSTTIAGGEAIYTGGSRCSLGFNVRDAAGQQFFLTAGHCTNIGATWYANAARTTVLGTRTGSSFPGNDYGIVRYTNTTIAKPGSVFLYPGSQDITTARNAVVGETVRRSGSTTQVRSGRVLAVNATVNYPQGTVTGLIRTNVCAQPGDSGGSLFAGTAALGLTSGGSGNCTTGGITFFQPVTEALTVYGVSVY